MNLFHRTLAAAAAMAVAAAAWGAPALKPALPTPKKHTSEAPAKVAQGVPAKTVYAWATRDRGDIPKGLVSFTLNKPQALTSLHALPETAYAGCYGGDKYYFDRYRVYNDGDGQTWAHIAFSSIDIATGKITDIKDWKDEIFLVNDMAYDYTTGLVYAMGRNIYQDDFLSSLIFEYSSLMTINPNTGVATEVKQFIDWGNGTLANRTYYTLACDLNGTLYSVDQNGCLVTFDRDNDYAETVIGSTGLNPAHTTQSMEFDHTTGQLYWAADFTSSPAALYLVDTASGHAECVGETGTDSHLVGLHIPFAVPSQAAPGSVSDLTVAPDASGAKTAALSWKLPLKSFGGYNLTSISSVKVLRDGAEVKSFTGVTPGQTMTYTDAVPAPGLYSYTVVAANSVGNGLPSGVTRWVGKDVPKGVEKLGVGYTPTGAHLEWEEPSEGLHGGVIDKATLGYKVTRFPDGTILASDVRGSSFDDNTSPAMGRYYYTVESHTAEGVGEVVSSVEIALGSGISTFPWSTLFADRSEFELWTVVDMNGGSSWSWKSRTAGDYTAQAMYGYDNDRSADDYLISPDLYLQKGGKYKVKFAYAGANANYVEKFEVTFGSGKSADEQTESLRRITATDGNFRFCEVEFPEIFESGVYNFAFHALSDPKQYNLYITDVTVIQTQAGEDPVGPGDTFDAPTGLHSQIDRSTGAVTLLWNAPGTSPVGPVTENISEDFENMTSWEINPSGDYGWQYVDGDGGQPYRSDYEDMPYPTDGVPLAAMVMTPRLLSDYVSGPNPPHSGENYLLFKSNYAQGDGSRPAPKPDDWFISPELNFGKDFVFRFWCKADPDADEQNAAWKWNKEEFRVGYSTTDASPESFKWLTDENERVVTAFDEWVKKEYSMPADARYVCIHYCTPSEGFWFMVDDVFIGVENPAAVKAEASAVRSYEVLVDDVKVGSTVETSYVLTSVTPGQHVAKVVAVYDGGRSAAAVHAFTVDQSGASLTASATVTVDRHAGLIRFGEKVGQASLHTLAGVGVATASDASALDISSVAQGVYILVIDGKASKIVLK